MKKIIKNLAYLCVLTMTLLCSGCGEEQVTISGNSEENVTEKVSQQGAEEAGEERNWGIVMRAYPNDSLVNWTIKEFGPFYIPDRKSVV